MLLIIRLFSTSMDNVDEFDCLLSEFVFIFSFVSKHALSEVMLAFVEVG